ncbi:MAG: FAD-dependent oxidoreductase [Moorellaceae bacterium]
MVDSYDAIVIGAGPAGSSAALMLAQNGLSVALLERGKFPGCKNVFGGTIYSRPTAEIIPAFWQSAPLERPVISDELWLLHTDSAVRIGFSSRRYARSPYNKFTVLRSRFDRWLAEQAAAAGAVLRTQAHAREFIYDRGFFTKGPIKGVKLDTGEILLSDVVIIAEGVLSFMTAKAGLIERQAPPLAYTLYVKEVLGLPQEKINDRFQLEDNEGAIIGMVGFPTATAIGKAGLWTNRDTISLVVGAYLNQLAEKGLSPYLLLQRLKHHPLVKRLVAGAEVLEYQAHMIPKGGYSFLPKLYGDHVLVAGDAAFMVSGRRGTDLAMLSGKYAAETVVQAKAKGDFSAKMLANYAQKISNTFFMEDIQVHQHTLRYYQERPDADYLISSTLNELADEFFTIDFLNEHQKKARLINIIQAKQFPWKTVSDIWAAIKHWGPF